jgi:hypothetical protein
MTLRGKFDHPEKNIQHRESRIAHPVSLPSLMSKTIPLRVAPSRGSAIPHSAFPIPHLVFSHRFPTCHVSQKRFWTIIVSQKRQMPVGQASCLSRCCCFAKNPDQLDACPTIAPTDTLSETRIELATHPKEI